MNVVSALREMEIIGANILVLILCVLKCLAMDSKELQDFKDFLEKTSALDQTLKGIISLLYGSCY